ncbi:MAG: DUF3305 domain-containing protein [Marivibrio sp.]|uniref:DUF3305 domain-containing protein n=1 Tax=Marivibrio sp. TaxID=2039719 RepID=UPI0032EAE504
MTNQGCDAARRGTASDGVDNATEADAAGGPNDSSARAEGAGTLDRQERRSVLQVGVVVERRPVANPWADDQYLPSAVVPNAGRADWTPLPSEPDDPPGVRRWLAATVEIALHRTESEAYLENLHAEQPAVYVVLRPSQDPDDPHEASVVCATLSPYEAQDFLDSGEDVVEPVPMPDQIAAWVRAFVARHHKEVPFKKRKRKPHTAEEPAFGKRLHPVERAFYERRERLRPDDETEGEA